MGEWEGFFMIADTVKDFLRRWMPAGFRRSFKKLIHSKEVPDWVAWRRQDERLWKQARRQAEHGPSVLIATSVGGHAPSAVTESLLGVALTLRGARVKFLLCDRALPACLKAHIDKIPDVGMLERYGLKNAVCDGCYRSGRSLFDATGLPTWKYSDGLSEAERRTALALAAQVPREEIGRYCWNGLAVGEHALAGALRFYARGQLEETPAAEMVLRRFFEAALLTGMAVKNLISRERFDAACFNHGIYVPHGPTAEACRQAGVRIVTWNVAYRKSCFIFSHDDTYHHTMLAEPAGHWENMHWGPAQEKETLDYLASRLTGARDWIWFHEKPFEDIDKIAQECGADFSKPCIGLLTNVFWDAQLHYRANAFPNMLEWIVQTIRYFEKRPDLQLLIRIHPAEVRGTIPSRQPLLEEIRKAFPRLPANVFIIPPESNSSTYAAMYKCDSVIIYGTKTGVELTSVGIPIIVAGEAWIRGKGVTQDADSPQEYFALLDQLPSGRRLEGATLERARKYAYHFFFRRMIPLSFMKPAQVSALFTVDISGLRDLLPGRHPGLDVICDGILHRQPFIYPAERLGAVEVQAA